MLGRAGITLVLTISACHLVWPFRSSESGKDSALAEASIIGDARPADGPANQDGARGDLRQSFDAVPDGTPIDFAPTDVISPADQQRSDANPATACAAGATRLPSNLDVFGAVVCTGSRSVSQCNAAGLCAQSWQLCTAQQYRNRSSNIAPNWPNAWIAGCVRNGPLSPVALDDSNTCSTCGVDPAPTTAVVSWACSTGQSKDSSDYAYVGITTAIACSRIGSNSASTQAAWATLPASSLVGRALCCAR
ncbi:MAG: hypothetical protein H6707_20345 [Deltaproteobacteria bacterium]|nr:hypothetical protein [Deltaproteobacteria bacterium]